MGLKIRYYLVYNMIRLPEEIINKIMLYNSHPISDIFKQSDYYIFFHKFRETDEFSKFVFIFIEYLRIEKKGREWDEIVAKLLCENIWD